MSPYKQLLISNKGRGEFKARPMANDAATIYLYDAIVGNDIDAEIFGGVGPEQFARTVAGVKAGTLNLRVNSPGGSVFAARTMAQALKDYPGKVIAHVDGLAASAASFLIMAADEIVMAEGSFLMIHNAWSIALGNADDLRQEADLLDSIDNSLVKTYAKRTGKDKDAIRGMMRAETWMDSDEAVANGFADRSAETSDAQASKQWDLSAYKNAPTATAEEPEPEVQAHDQDNEQDNEQEQSKRRIDLARRALLTRLTD
jgi:ATP-dependent Clp protease protease subunit